MNKKEFNELKKTYTAQNTHLVRMAGSYVDGEGNVKASWNEPFLSIKEEDLFKYLEIFKKAMGGIPGKTVRELPVIESRVLLQEEVIRNDMRDEKAIEEYHGEIIDNYEHVGNYLILSALGVYDIPGKTKDGIELEDGSEEVYTYLLTVICPVGLQKAALAYDAESQTFANMVREWILQEPAAGFLYPAFTERSADRKHVEYYTKKLDDETKELAKKMFGIELDMTPGEERESFEMFLTQVLGDGGTIQQIRVCQEAVSSYVVAEGYENGMVIGLRGIHNILDEYLTEAQKKRVDDAWMGNIGNNMLHSRFITKDAGWNIFNESMNVRMNKYQTADRAKVKADEGGQKYLVIEIDGDLFVDGIHVG